MLLDNRLMRAYMQGYDAFHRGEPASNALLYPDSAFWLKGWKRAALDKLKSV